MDDDLDRFRERARCFLSIHATATPAAPNDDPRRDLALDRALDFQRALQAAGLAGLTVPAALGGHGLPAAYETAWREEAGRFPLMTEQLSITLGNCLPTLLQFGTVEQQCRHVPRILAGHEVWCQLFSEPEAGSDLAAVRTHAIAVGDGWIVNGQKIWTTLAHRADFGILLARTDTAAEKHDGLSMLIVDLRAPGVDIRPIRQLDGAQALRRGVPHRRVRALRRCAPPVRSRLAHRDRDAPPSARRPRHRPTWRRPIRPNERPPRRIPPSPPGRSGAARRPRTHVHRRGLPEPARHQNPLPPPPRPPTPARPDRWAN